MIDRQDLITTLMPLLEEAMREKAAKNGHKKPLSEETDSDLRDMAQAENGEFELELAWVKRFGREPRAVLLEMADWIILRAEQARRVGALARDPDSEPREKPWPRYPLFDSSKPPVEKEGE